MSNQNKTPQQQAEELANNAAAKSLEYLAIDPNYEFGQDRANIANLICTAIGLSDLIQAKDERDQLKQQLEEANIQIQFHEHFIDKLTAERDGLKKQLQMENVFTETRLGVIKQLQSANAELVKACQLALDQDAASARDYTETGSQDGMWLSCPVREAIESAMKGSK